MLVYQMVTSTLNLATFGVSVASRWHLHASLCAWRWAGGKVAERFLEIGIYQIGCFMVVLWWFCGGFLWDLQ